MTPTHQNGEKELTLTTFRADTFRKSCEILRFPRLGIYQVLGYVNGLMLVFRQNPGINSELMLWNPSIRKCLILPPCAFGFFRTSFLGFDTSSNDYKVVVIDYSQSRGLIYDLSKGTWRTMSFDNIPVFFVVGRAVYFQGAVHWITMNGNRTLLVSFDLGSETLSIGDLPDNGDDDHAGEIGCRVLFVLGESLALFDARPSGCFIWVMKKHDGNQLWTKMYSRGLSIEGYSSLCNALKGSLCYVEKSGMFLMYSDKEVLSYDVKNDQLKQVAKLNQFDWVEFMDTYVESLALVRGLESQTLTSL